MADNVALLTEQLAAVMAHNGIASPAEAFLFFDLDQDDKISVADLFSACTEVQIAVSEQVVADWIAYHAQHGDRTALTPDAWHAALQHVDGNTVLERLAEEGAHRNVSAAAEETPMQREVSATDSEYQRMREEQEAVMRDMQEAAKEDPSGSDRERQGIHAQLRKAEALLARDEHAKVHGSLDGGHASSSSTVSSPAESAGSGEEFEVGMHEPVRAAPGLSRDGLRRSPSNASCLLQAAVRRSITERQGEWAKGALTRREIRANRWRVRQERAAVKIQARTRGMAARKMHAASAAIEKGERQHPQHFADEESVAFMKRQHNAAILIQARQRGLSDRKRVHKMRHELAADKIRASTYADDDFEGEDYDDEFEEDDAPQWHGAEYDAAAAHLQAVCRAKMSVKDFALSRARASVHDSLALIEKERAEKYEASQLRLKLLREERGRNGGDVLAVQIDMIESDWAAADRHKRVLKYATERLARSIVHDLIDSTVEQQEVWRARRERARVRQEVEENRGYRKPRVVDSISEHIKHLTCEEIVAQQRFHDESNRWYQHRGKMLRALEEEEQVLDIKKTRRTEEYIAARREKVDRIYEEREREKVLNKQRVDALKEKRKLEKAELVKFVSRQKAQEEAQVEKELKATVALDAQRRNQMILAQVHKERMIEEKETLHELGVKAARRKVLKQEKQEQEFQKKAQKLVKAKEKRNLVRKAKREELMVLYESALQHAEDLKKSQSSLSAPGAKDPNETLKFAIGAYFSDPGNSVVLSSTKKMMGSLMFVQKEGAGEWTEKRVEQRLKEIFQWMDKDSTGQVEQKELHGALQRLGGSIKASDVDHLLASMDSDGDGQLTLEEFVDFGKGLFSAYSDVSGSKVLTSSPPRTATGSTRAATPEVIAANKREREARLAAARRSKEQEDREKLRKVQERKARAEERRRFVDEAVSAYEEARAEKTKAKDEEMVQMIQMIEDDQKRRKVWFEKQWSEMRAVEEKAGRTWQLSRAASAGDRQASEQEEQRKIAKLRNMQDTFKYEKSITAEFLVSSVESRRRMASAGFPVAVAPRESASRVMEAVSSVYLAKPRKSAARREGSTRPHTSLGFAEDAPDESSQHPSSEADPQQRLQLGAHDREAALKYFIRFGTTTRLGEKLMPFYRFDRLVHAMKIAPTLLSDSDVANIYNLARGKDGWDDVYTEHLTQPQFLRAIFHVSEWTGRSFLEMSILGEQVEASFTNRKDWSTDLRSSAYEHPLLAKSVEASNSGSLSSFAQSSLPVLQGGTGLPATPLLGVRAPKSKADYLRMRKHMKVARCTSVKAMGELPQALRGPHRLRHSADSSNFLDFDASDIMRDYRDISYGHFEDNLPSISPSEMPSQASSFLGDGSFPSIMDKSTEGSDGQRDAKDMNLTPMPGERTFLSSFDADDASTKPRPAPDISPPDLLGNAGRGAGARGLKSK